MCTAVQYKMKLDWENHSMIEFYLDFDVSDFYAWNFPKKNYFNVGVIGNLKKLNKFCDKYNIRGEILKTEGHLIPFGGSKIHSGKYYLIGDAAGMVNPFTKGGLAPIIYASEILSDCLKKGEGKHYETRIMNHPAFSKSYRSDMDLLLSLTQTDLRNMGRIVHDKDMLNLTLNTKIKTLRHPRLISKMQRLLKAFDASMKHGW